MKNQLCFIFMIASLSLVSCTKKAREKRVILAIPVYGQSLALGEQAIRITDFDSLTKQSRHLVLTENLDEEFGYLSDTHFKQWMKKVLHDRHRAFELSIYGMSEVVTKHFQDKGYGDKLMLCTFASGRGATGIKDLSKGSLAYEKFLDEITTAYNKAQGMGWTFVVPAFCWMQGEDDIVWNKSTNYKKDLKTFQTTLNKDIKAITKQKRDVVCICYQTNCLTLSKKFNSISFDSRETSVPEGQMELVRDDKMFMSSGPTYPYCFLEKSAHIDGLAQKRLGYLAGLSVIRLLEAHSGKGLIPTKFTVYKDTVTIKFHVPRPPLAFDTAAVFKAENYGFSVIDSGNNNIVKTVILKNDLVKICCKRSPVGCKVKYAVNGVQGENGYKTGPRGNLRDSQGKELTANILKKNYPLHNWCYQFDVLVKN